jgi:hypothetical protein
MDEDGYIGKEELRAVVTCLLHDGSGPLITEGDAVRAVPNIEELFDVIDNNPKDGRIDLEEFKIFYDTILLPSTSRTSTAHMSVVSARSHAPSSRMSTAEGSIPAEDGSA